MGEAYVVHDPDSFQSETVGSLPVHWEPGGTSSPQVIGDGMWVWFMALGTNVCAQGPSFR